MTHEELIEKINFSNSAFEIENALLAVVELHKSDGNFCVECSHDVDYLFNYPCKTIQAIEKELQ